MMSHVLVTYTILLRKKSVLSRSVSTIHTHKSTFVNTSQTHSTIINNSYVRV
jgi:hypothetical protein